MQQWYNLSDPAMEDALYEIASMRLFADLSLDKAIPDHSTILKFRHLLEQHDLARQIFDEVNQWLSRRVSCSRKAPDRCHHYRSPQFNKEPHRRT
jgi:IS5 family transposase